MRGFYYYLIGIALLIISFFLDNTVSGFFLNNRLGFLDGIAIFIHSVEGYVLFLFVFVILLLFKQKKRILPLLLAIILYFGVTGLIKIIIARPRPFTKFDFPNLGETRINQSFPSGHVTAAASVIRFFEFNRMLLWIWAAITVLVMFSRVYLGMHYLSDVVAGLILGYFISDSSIFLAEKLKR
ncbi:MAG: phosphatase PAP2 family protein [Nanoarchaeota archaeon]